MRGFALRSDWVLGFASNALLCLEGLNKSLNRRFVADNSTPHPPGPLSPKRGEGSKVRKIWVKMRGDSPGCRWKAEHLLSLPGFAFVTWLRFAAVLDECQALKETGAMAQRLMNR